MNDCIFCKIAQGQIPSKKVYEDDLVYAFYDINPQAKTHVLIIPKEHISSCADVNEKNSSVVAHIFEVIPKIAESEGLKNGFRVISNCGPDACQSVLHLHFHLLGGEQMSEKMA
ncbi:MAG: histidine triad nucleotide-binding protein [Clostridia bacterium]|nr:histidine triad nucleotide-binding protein [Clostridia bacterium]